MRRALGPLTVVVRRSAGALAGVALIILTVALAVDAVLRYLLLRPSQWLPSISADALLPIIVIMPMALAALGGDHIRMGFFYERFPERGRVLVDRFSHVLAVLFWGLVSWTTGGRSLDRVGRGLTSATGTDIPEFIALGLVSIGALLMAAVSVVLAIVGADPSPDPDAEPPLEM